MTFPDLKPDQVQFQTSMEAVTLFLQESLDARRFFADNRTVFEECESKNGKWTPAQVLAHLNFWEDWMYENRFIPIENKAKELVLSNWQSLNPESADLHGKSYMWHLDSWVARRKRLINFLGQQEDDVWNWKSRHPEYGRTDYFFWVAEMMDHDCTHGKSVRDLYLRGK